jgi:hypothetical protein
MESMRRETLAPGIEDLNAGRSEFSDIARDHGHPVHHGGSGNPCVTLRSRVRGMQTRTLLRDHFVDGQNSTGKPQEGLLTPLADGLVRSWLLGTSMIAPRFRTLPAKPALLINPDPAH